MVWAGKLMVSQHINSCLLSQILLKYIRIIIIEDNVNYYLLQAHFLVEIHSKHPIIATQAGLHLCGRSPPEYITCSYICIGKYSKTFITRAILSITMYTLYIPECSTSLHGVSLIISCLLQLPPPTVNCSH